MAGAKFSAEFNLFGGIDTVRELTHQARRLLFLLLCGCSLAWLCITATTDARLLTNASIALFPELSLPIPSVAVFNLTPILLVLLYIYLHLYLQRLWEEMATLPAIFPDGRPLDRAVYPWLLHGLVRVYNGRLQHDRCHG